MKKILFFLFCCLTTESFSSNTKHKLKQEFCYVCIHVPFCRGHNVYHFCNYTGYYCYNCRQSIYYFYGCNAHRFNHYGYRIIYNSNSSCEKNYKKR